MKFLDAAEIERLHRPAELVEALRRAFAGAVISPPRAHLPLGEGHEDGVLLLMPAWRRQDAIGVKIVTVLPRAAEAGKPTVNGVYVLLTEHGEVRALMDAKALTLARTAAVSALAASVLVPAEAKVLLMVGTGALAPHLIGAHAAVRAYEEVLVWGRSLDKAAALAAELSRRGLPVRPAPELEAAARAADVVSCATLSQSPLVHGGWLKPGAHLDLVGGYTLQMREADDQAVRRADVFVDTANALAEAGDLADPVRAGLLDPARVVELSELVTTGPRARRGDISLFKSVGTAVSDFAAAELFAGG
jgi:ornithine cyclodeaminase